MGVSGGWLEKNNQTYLSTDLCVFFKSSDYIWW
jgi:hypothetical protein